MDKGDKEVEDERSMALLSVKVGVGKPSFFDLENLQKRSRAARLPCLDKEGHYFPEECYYISRVGNRPLFDKDIDSLVKRRSLGMANTWTDYRGHRHPKAEGYRFDKSDFDPEAQQVFADYSTPEAEAVDWDVLYKDHCAHVPSSAQPRVAAMLCGGEGSRQLSMSTRGFMDPKTRSRITEYSIMRQRERALREALLREQEILKQGRYYIYPSQEFKKREVEVPASEYLQKHPDAYTRAPDYVRQSLTKRKPRAMAGRRLSLRGTEPAWYMEEMARQRERMLHDLYPHQHPEGAAGARAVKDWEGREGLDTRAFEKPHISGPEGGDGAMRYREEGDDEWEPVTAEKLEYPILSRQARESFRDPDAPTGLEWSDSESDDKTQKIRRSKISQALIDAGPLAPTRSGTSLLFKTSDKSKPADTRPRDLYMGPDLMKSVTNPEELEIYKDMSSEERELCRSMPPKERAYFWRMDTKYRRLYYDMTAKEKNLIWVLSTETRMNFWKMTKKEQEAFWCLSPKERCYILRMSDEESELFWSYHPTFRLRLMSMSPEEAILFWKMPDRHRLAIMQLAPGERNIFWNMTPVDRMCMYQLSLVEINYFWHQTPEQGHAFLQMSPKEMQFFWKLPPELRVQFLILSPDERKTVWKLDYPKQISFMCISPDKRILISTLSDPAMERILLQVENRLPLKYRNLAQGRDLQPQDRTIIGRFSRMLAEEKQKHAEGIEMRLEERKQLEKDRQDQVRSQRRMRREMKEGIKREAQESWWKGGAFQEELNLSFKPALVGVTSSVELQLPEFAKEGKEGQMEAANKVTGPPTFAGPTPGQTQVAFADDIRSRPSKLSLRGEADDAHPPARRPMEGSQRFQPTDDRTPDERYNVSMASAPMMRPQEASEERVTRMPLARGPRESPAVPEELRRPRTVGVPGAPDASAYSMRPVPTMTHMDVRVEDHSVIPSGMRSPKSAIKQKPAGVAQVPLDVAQIPSGMVQVPAGMMQVPAGMMQVPAGMVRVPAGMMQVPAGMVQVPAGMMQVPAGMMQVPAGMVQDSAGSIPLALYAPAVSPTPSAYSAPGAPGPPRAPGVSAGPLLMTEKGRASSASPTHYPETSTTYEAEGSRQTASSVLVRSASDDRRLSDKMVTSPEPSQKPRKDHSTCVSPTPSQLEAYGPSDKRTVPSISIPHSPFLPQKTDSRGTVFTPVRDLPTYYTADGTPDLQAQGAHPTTISNEFLYTKDGQQVPVYSIPSLEMNNYYTADGVYFTSIQSAITTSSMSMPAQTMASPASISSMQISYGQPHRQLWPEEYSEQIMHQLRQEQSSGEEIQGDPQQQLYLEELEKASLILEPYLLSSKATVHKVFEITVPEGAIKRRSSRFAVNEDPVQIMMDEIKRWSIKGFGQRGWVLKDWQLLEGDEKLAEAEPVEAGTAKTEDHVIFTFLCTNCGAVVQMNKKLYDLAHGETKLLDIMIRGRKLQLLLQELRP